MKKTISSIASFILATIFIISTIFTGLPITAHAEDGVTLKLHYNRPDGNYTGWDVWLWPEGGEGAGYPFADENGEMVATMEVSAGTTNIGFIVRTEDWTKDINEDHFPFYEKFRQLEAFFYGEIPIIITSWH